MELLPTRKFLGKGQEKRGKGKKNLVTCDCREVSEGEKWRSSKFGQSSPASRSSVGGDGEHARQGVMATSTCGVRWFVSLLCQTHYIAPGAPGKPTNGSFGKFPNSKIWLDISQISKILCESLQNKNVLLRKSLSRWF
jgi:hypothetical protein